MRLDVALVRAGLARSRTHAGRLIADGRARVNDRPVTKAAHPVGADDRLAIAGDDPWVSRAAHKLLGALDDLDLEPAGRALDAGASTGGFTQVLRRAGCEPVYAADVGHGQLAEEIRADPAVRVREGLNLRELELEHLDGLPVDVVVVDVSFISLTLLVGPLLRVARPDALVLLMVKPQFEVGRGRLGKHGVVTDEGLRREAVDVVADAATGYGWRETARVVSRLPGPAGNIEYFLQVCHDSAAGACGAISPERVDDPERVNHAERAHHAERGNRPELTNHAEGNHLEAANHPEPDAP